MTAVSVIIPVWNTQDYVAQCLDSVQQQTLSDLEIICVDDGSDDGSVDIIRARGIVDARIRLFVQKHQGPGSARNLGIDEARGEYLYFLDSDDWIVPDALERLVMRAREDNADLLFFEPVNRERSTRRRRQSEGARRQLAGQVMAGVDYLEPAIEAEAFSFSPCLQFSRRSLVRDSGVRYPLYDMSEDSVFTIRLTLCAKRVSYIPEHLFYRRLRAGSLTTRGNRIPAIRGALGSWNAINSLREDYAVGTSAHRALGVLARRQWRYALNQWDFLPPALHKSLSWPNILEDDEPVSRQFLLEARRGSKQRAVIRFLRGRKPLTIESSPRSDAE